MDFNTILSGIKNFLQPKPISPYPEGYNPQNQEAYSLIKKYRPQYKGSYNDINSLLEDFGEEGVLGEIRSEMGGVSKRPMITQATPIQATPIQVAPTQRPQQQVLGSSEGRPVTERQIREGWENYGDGNAPAATASATFAEVANQYPLLRENPGLLPAMAMKETSGGKASQNKNWFNWGIYDKGYNETDPNQVIRDVAAAIAGEDSPSSHYYEKFRETGNIKDMLNRYAPPTENDTNLYHKQLLDWMRMFR